MQPPLFINEGPVMYIYPNKHLKILISSSVMFIEPSRFHEKPKKKIIHRSFLKSGPLGELMGQCFLACLSTVLF